MGVKEQFKMVAGFCRKNDIPFAVAGAFAMHGVGYVRATRDLDFVLPEAARDVVIEFLESLGYETLSASQAFSHHLHALENARIDLIYVDPKTAERVFPASREFNFFSDLALPVLDPLHQIAMKLHAIAHQPDRFLKDLADIREIVVRADIRKDEVTDLFAKYGLEQHLPLVIEETP